MITQTLLRELEMALIRSYGHAVRKSSANSSLNYPTTTAFISAMKTQEDFITHFMSAFKERSALLEAEIRKGGYKDAAKRNEQLQREVESRMRAYLLKRNNRPSEATFSQLVRQFKIEVRSIFYDTYTGTGN